MALSDVMPPPGQLVKHAAWDESQETSDLPESESGTSPSTRKSSARHYGFRVSDATVQKKNPPDCTTAHNTSGGRVARVLWSAFLLHILPIAVTAALVVIYKRGVAWSPGPNEINALLMQPRSMNISSWVRSPSSSSIESEPV